MNELFTDKLELENDIIIERAHRATKKSSKYGKKDQPWTIVCKLLSYKDKVKVLQNFKKLKGNHINEDFCQAMLQYRKELWKEVKRLREEEDKIAYKRLCEEEDKIVYLRYCSLVVKDKNNVR